MYRFYINNIDNEYHYSELARVFLDNSEFEIIPVNFDKNFYQKINFKEGSFFIDTEEDNLQDRRDAVKRDLYKILTELTGSVNSWGTLTGVHPLKLAYKEKDKNPNNKPGIFDAYEYIALNLKERYLIKDEKIDLLIDIMKYQDNRIPGTGKRIPFSDENVVSLYIGIPFCPTRCEYCSFASVVADKLIINDYFNLLLKEIEYTGKLSVHKGYKIESLYIGGGTPTVLEASRIRTLINAAIRAFKIDVSKAEITVEAGRPDTLSIEKLRAMESTGVNRISINPQSMIDRTLELIGRSHSAEDIYKAFDMVRMTRISNINSDIIAGLQGETLEDFQKTVDGMIELNPSNVTVHTLSVKKGSILKERAPKTYRTGTEVVSRMLDYSYNALKKAGYYPYYIYKQKQQIGDFENVGWCKPGTHSRYNVRIIEENQSIIALGAGAVGKKYFPDGDNNGVKIKRISNVSNYMTYMERFDQILIKKNSYF